MDTVGMELGKLLPRITQMLRRIQEIRQEQDTEPNKALAKYQPGPRENRNTVKLWIKVPCSWEKKAHKTKQKPTNNFTWKTVYQKGRELHFSFHFKKKE